MEPSADASPGVDPRFARRFRERAGGDGPVSFADFMDLALFDSEVGYYAAARQRVGRERGTDFYTASSMSRVFGPLVASAATALAGGPGEARQLGFVEIGAETDGGILAGVGHAFREARVVRLGQAVAVPERAIVFSNELFDAQPFHRLTWRAGAWREAGVVLGDGALAWSELPEVSAELESIRDELPTSAEDGYILDVPWRAVRLLERLVSPAWSGLFIAFDYGRRWSQLCEDLPQGSGRAYGAHRQRGDLLASPGRQDLTCHVCWDWLEATLRRSGFSEVRRESQESFFVKHASPAIEAIVRSEPGPFSPARSQLKQLLHPGLMGHRFEVLWARR